METVMPMKFTTNFLFGINYISLLQVKQNKNKRFLKYSETSFFGLQGLNDSLNALSVNLLM